jgi:PhnB protein
VIGQAASRGRLNFFQKELLAVSIWGVFVRCMGRGTLKGRDDDMKLLTYLNFGGNCREAFRFYEEHLGGKITMIMTHGEAPHGNEVPADRKNAIVHARMLIGETELLASDVPPENFQPIRSSYLYLSFGSTTEVERVYALLSDGGQVFMPMDETFFAIRFGALRDKFGTSWMLIQERPRP